MVGISFGRVFKDAEIVGVRFVVNSCDAGGVIRPTNEKDLWKSIFNAFPKNPGNFKTFTNPDTGETKRGIDNIQWDHFNEHPELNPQDFKDQQIKNVFNQAAALDFLQKFNPFA